MQHEAILVTQSAAKFLWLNHWPTDGTFTSEWPYKETILDQFFL